MATPNLYEYEHKVEMEVERECARIEYTLEIRRLVNLNKEKV